MIADLPPLLAAIEVDDVIRILVIMGFILFPLLGGIWKRIVQSAAQPRPPGKGDVFDEPVEGMGPGAGGIGPRGDVMESQIENFLRRAAGKRPEVVMARQETPQVQYVEEVEIIDEGLGASSESVSDHVKKSMDSGKFDGRVGQLDQRISAAEKSLEEHVHEKFDHKFGRFVDGPVREERPSKTLPKPSQMDAATALSESEQLDRSVAARNVAAMLQNPSNLRHAIILNEIFRRPEV